LLEELFLNFALAGVEEQEVKFLVVQALLLLLQLLLVRKAWSGIERVILRACYIHLIGEVTQLTRKSQLYYQN
jgi:hypothetical protein